MRILLSIITLILGFGFSIAHADYDAGKRAYDVGDYETAYNEWLPLAEARDKEAAHKLGYMNSEGLGRPIDLIEAQKWYLIAADSNRSNSAYNIALILLSGELTDTYVDVGNCWLVLAEQRGSTYATEFIQFVVSKGVSEYRIYSSVELMKKGMCTTAPLP